MRLVKGITLAVGVVVPLLLCFVTVHQAFSSCAGSCCGSDLVAWNPNPKSITSAGDGSFSTSVTFSWCWTDEDRDGLYQGSAVEYTGSQNIGSVTYTPDLFFADAQNCCAESISISIEGALGGSGNGTLKSRGSMSWPVEYQIHTTYITHG